MRPPPPSSKAPQRSTCKNHMRRRTRRFDLAAGAVLVAVAALAYGVNAATANPVVVSVAVPQGQTLRQLIAGTFIEKLRCSVSCRATTNLVLSGKLARQLHFPGAKSSLPYGISLISRCQPPPFSRSTSTLARSRKLPRYQRRVLRLLNCVGTPVASDRGPLSLSS